MDDRWKPLKVMCGILIIVVVIIALIGMLWWLAGNGNHVRGGYSQANSRNNLCVHRTSSNCCNVSVPEDLLQAYNTRHSVQNIDRSVLYRVSSTCSRFRLP